MNLSMDLSIENPKKAPMDAAFFSRAGCRWDVVRVFLNEKPDGMSEKAYWEAEIRALRACHDELRDAPAFVLTSPTEKGWWS